MEFELKLDEEKNKILSDIIVHFLYHILYIALLSG